MAYDVHSATSHVILHIPEALRHMAASAGKQFNCRIYLMVLQQLSRNKLLSGLDPHSNSIAATWQRPKRLE